MPIDSREKRASALAMIGMMYHLPLADSTIGAADRAQVTWAYSGISYSAAQAVTVTATRFAYELELYDKNGDLKSIMTKRALIEWEYHRTGGCGQANVRTTYPCGGVFDGNLMPGDEVRVQIKNELRYSGKLLKIEREVRSGRDGIDLVFYGYGTELHDIIISQSFQNTEVSQIIKSILDTNIVGSSKITYDSADIEETDFSIEDVTFNHSVIDAFTFLGNLAGDVEWGVDRNKKFYFKKRDRNIRRVFVIGRDVYQFKEIEDHEAVKNKVFVYGANQSLITTLTSAGSQSIFGTREENIFETAISEQSDANRLGAVTLKNLANRARQIKVKRRLTDDFIESSHPLGATAVAKEPFSIASKYGTNFKYGENRKYGNFKRDQIRSIRYFIAGGGIETEILISEDIPHLGSQQKQVEFQIKELQRR